MRRCAQAQRDAPLPLITTWTRGHPVCARSEVAALGRRYPAPPLTVRVLPAPTDDESDKQQSAFESGSAPQKAPRTLRSLYTDPLDEQQ
jgi:hypothetical protein